MGRQKQDRDPGPEIVRDRRGFTSRTKKKHERELASKSRTGWDPGQRTISEPGMISVLQQAETVRLSKQAEIQIALDELGLSQRGGLCTIEDILSFWTWLMYANIDRITPTIRLNASKLYADYLGMLPKEHTVVINLGPVMVNLVSKLEKRFGPEVISVASEEIKLLEDAETERNANGIEATRDKLPSEPKETRNEDHKVGIANAHDASRG